MQIMVDTNVIISGLLYPNSTMNSIMTYIMDQHKLLISSYVLAEFKDVIRRKFPSNIAEMDELLSKMSYELVYTPDTMDFKIFSVRDAADYPVLYTAIVENVDILITGDKDLINVDIKTPRILTPRQYMDLYMVKPISRERGNPCHS